MRNDQVQKQLAAANAALRDNAVRMFDQTRALQPSVVNMMLRQQQQVERLLRPSYVEQMARLSKQIDMLRPSYFAQFEKMQRQLRPTLVSLHSMRAPLIAQVEQMNTQLGLGHRKPVVPFQNRALASFTRGYANLTDDLAHQIQSALRPNYFGALQQFNRLTTQPDLLGLQRLAEQLRAQWQPAPLYQLGRLSEHLRRPPWLDDLRGKLTGALDGYLAWLEREWAEVKMRQTPPPLIFLLASLPAIVGLQLLNELETDDRLLLARLEEELARGTLVEELQAALQPSTALDPVAKRHLVQALSWVRRGQYVDAAPPLYQGLERALKLTARRQGVIDDKNHFLVPGAHRRKARSVEDVFTYLGLDRLYIRFLRVWIFGEMGNLARHGDLAEDEHRRWVLRAVVALVGWIEYVGGEEDAVAQLVERLELERGDDADEVAG